jgi:hypothetical protein
VIQGRAGVGAVAAISRRRGGDAVPAPDHPPGERVDRGDVGRALGHGMRRGAVRPGGKRAAEGDAGGGGLGHGRGPAALRERFVVGEGSAVEVGEAAAGVARRATRTL